MSSAESHKAVAKQVRTARTSFYWPMLLQPQAQRRALFAIYAYCRTLDDIADGASPIAEKNKALSLWRNHVTHGFASTGSGSSEVLLLNALKDVVEQFDLPTTPFLALIDGMESDVNGPIVAPSWAALETYCGQVAGAVGDLCLCVWGWRGFDAQAFAKATGEALQLTNILRDVKDDAQDGRLYLPRECLTAAEIGDNAPAAVVAHPKLDLALQPVFEHAEQRFTEAKSRWPQDAPPSLRPAWVMLSLYQALFNKVVETGVGPDKPRARLSRLAKMRHLAAAYMSVP